LIRIRASPSGLPLEPLNPKTRVALALFPLKGAAAKADLD
jgi:hypothetical protein